MDEPTRLPSPADVPRAVTRVLADDEEMDVLTDEEAARRARELYREHGLPTIEPDEIVAPVLVGAEQVHGWRPQAGLSRVDERRSAVVRDEGPLYITNQRLLHFGRQATSLALTEIEELAMADDRILVTLSSARGLMLDLESPRQLRVLLAAARGAASR